MTRVNVQEKYERYGWPSLDRPDISAPDGWSLSLITSFKRIYNHKLSPDGEKIAYLCVYDGWAELYVVPVAGGWPSQLTWERKSTPYWWDEIPQWSPDGKWLALTIGDHVHLIPAAGGQAKKVLRWANQSSHPVWMSDGRRLILTIQQEDERSKLFMVDIDGKQVRRLTGGSGDDFDPQPSPDSRSIVYTHKPEDDYNSLQLRLIDLESGEDRPIRGAAKHKDWSPRWSPNGERITFLSQGSGFNEIWLAGLDGSIHQLTHLNQDAADPVWSPQGDRIACTVNRQGVLDITVIDISNGEATFLTQSNGIYSNLCWSPSGEFLTAEYESPLQPPDIFRIELSGDKRQTQITSSQIPAIARLPLVLPEPVTYSSFDGMQIPAILFRPRRSNGAGILYPHGGPTEQYVYYWDILTQYLLAKGYTILAPNYRGSTGYGVDYEHANYNDWGGSDVQDCLYGARFLSELDEIDPDCIGISGASYGGYLTACCLSRDPDYLFACGISKYGDANLITSWAQTDRSTRTYTEMQIGNPPTNRLVYLAGSPIAQVENIRKPVLILHGLGDDVVPPQASEEWVEVLRIAGKTFEYKTYASEPHGFQTRLTQLDAYTRMERFLDWYLLPRDNT